VYLFGAVFSLLFSFPFFWLVDTRDALLVALAIVLGLNLGHGAMYATQASFFSELFGTRVRYSGASLGYQLASVFAGGLSPIIATALLAQTGSFVPVALYLVFMAVVTVISVWMAAETRHYDVDAEHPEEARRVALDEQRYAPAPPPA
jgi:MFS family permease